jgi:ABC-type dipeptide/oligopeptide/nickel transport systems, permease components
MWKQLRSSGTGLLGISILVIVLFCALAADWISPYDPLKQDLANSLQPPFWAEGGSAQYLLGTDQLGRDILSRILHGSRISLLISVAGTVVAIVTGLLLGSVSGYFGGRIDVVIMRLADITMAFPFVLLAIFIVAILGPGILNLILVAGVSAGVRLTRTVRGEILFVKDQEYIEAIRSVGAKHSRIIAKHILPNIGSALIVIATLEMAQLILVESALSFLGLGVPAEVPTWGKMLSESRILILSEPWVSIFPGVAITITVLGINLLGDWLRDYLDPKLGKRTN